MDGSIPASPAKTIHSAERVNFVPDAGAVSPGAGMKSLNRAKDVSGTPIVPRVRVVWGASAGMRIAEMESGKRAKNATTATD